ncbi:hypothetical protein NQZ68_031036 [Dissostichus eleginoides]|nr:hypothetical protein NQZ68_031036 [Dissostichus eleginoides]
MTLRLDEGGGIEETLRRNMAKYHQSCRLQFNNTKLGREREELMHRVSRQQNAKLSCEEPAMKVKSLNASSVKKKLQYLNSDMS